MGEGAVGKTALEIAMALSLATGRYDLLGEHVFQRCIVLLVCFEDGKDELRRRLTAAMLHHGISKGDIQGHLFITALSRPDAKMAAVKNGEIVAGNLADALARSIERRQADAVFLDPFIKTHSVNENDNSAIDYVVEMLVDLMIRYDCSICVPHHTRKGPADPGNADTGRGASAFKDAGRLGYTLNKMTADDAKLFGLGAEEAGSLVRLDHAKVNLTPNATQARWFKLVGVSIGNGTPLYPKGDNIQTVERWYPPDHFKGVADAVWNKILDDINAGTEDGGKYSDANKTGPKRQAWRVVARHTDKTEDESKQIIRTWKKNGVIIAEKYHDPIQPKEILGFVVDDHVRPGHAL